MNKFKKFLYECKLTKNLYIKLGALKRKRIKKKKLKYMHKYGSQTVAVLQTILEQCGIMFFFDMGTLLGIIREGGLLKHDLDIDIGIVVSDEAEKNIIRTCLENAGAKRQFYFTIDEIGVVEESYMLNKIKFDVNYYYEEDGKNVCYLMYHDQERIDNSNLLNVVKLYCNKFAEVCKTDFGGGQINIPKNPKEYLATRYGDDWEIPNTNYVYWKGPSATPTTLKAEKIVCKN